MSDSIDHFVPDPPPMSDSSQYRLVMVQQPKEGRLLPKNQRAKGHTWPIDPPPVLELEPNGANSNDKRYFIHNPAWFCRAELLADDAVGTRIQQVDRVQEGGVSGSWSSSLHRVRGGPKKDDIKDLDHGYFVFGDINVMKVGSYRLRFTLYEMRRHHEQLYAAQIHSVLSNTFQVYGVKRETLASTPFSRHLADAGVKVKLRSEATKRKPAKIDWSSKQSDSMVRPVQLAPLYGRQHSMSNGLRAQNNLGVDITDRVQTTHAPLSSMSYIPPTAPLPGNFDYGAWGPPASSYPAYPHFNTSMPPQFPPPGYGANQEGRQQYYPY